MKRLSPLLAAAILALGACGTAQTDDLPPLSDMTETYGCGHGFWIGNPDQTAALRFAYLGEDGQAIDAGLPDTRWRAELLLGEDLYANWCDDVIESGEPEPVVTQTLEVVGGSLRIRGEQPSQPFTPGRLTLEATGITVKTADGDTVMVGDVTIENPSYGLFAG